MSTCARITLESLENKVVCIVPAADIPLRDKDGTVVTLQDVLDTLSARTPNGIDPRTSSAQRVVVSTRVYVCTSEQVRLQCSACPPSTLTLLATSWGIDVYAGAQEHSTCLMETGWLPYSHAVVSIPLTADARTVDQPIHVTLVFYERNNESAATRSQSVQGLLKCYGRCGSWKDLDVSDKALCRTYLAAPIAPPPSPKTRPSID